MTRQQRPLLEPLDIAAITGVIVVGTIVVVDIVTDGKLDPLLTALLVSVISPLVPAFILRRQRNGNGKDER